MTNAGVGGARSVTRGVMCDNGGVCHAWRCMWAGWVTCMAGWVTHGWVCDVYIYICHGMYVTHVGDVIDTCGVLWGRRRMTGRACNPTKSRT